MRVFPHTSIATVTSSRAATGSGPTAGPAGMRALLPIYDSPLSYAIGRRAGFFDRYYAQNELGYHRTVNGVVEDAFIPNIENKDVKDAFSQALRIFRGHEGHAERMVAMLDDS